MKTSSPATDAVWAGEEDLLPTGATTVPVSFGVAHGYPDMETWPAVALGQAPGYIFARNTNPTVAAFERKIQALERAEDATSFSTGMAAISNMLFALLKPGDRVVSAKDTYGGTNQIFLSTLPRWGVEMPLCETGDADAIEAAIGKGCALLYLETPTNPTLKVQPIARLAAAARKAGAVVAVDNTFATPVNQNPLGLGADLIIHSATKYLDGHADTLGGALCGRRDLVRAVFHHREINGASLDPMSAYLLLRGMKTPHLRVERQNESALQWASPRGLIRYSVGIEAVDDLIADLDQALG